MALMGRTPAEVANNLAFLQIDLTDPDFHRHALAGSSGTRAGIRALVRDAISAGELRRCDPGRLASALQATLNGSLLSWAIHRTGKPAVWIRRDLQAVLAPYRQAEKEGAPAGLEGNRHERRRETESNGRARVRTPKQSGPPPAAISTWNPGRICNSVQPLE